MTTRAFLCLAIAVVALASWATSATASGSYSVYACNASSDGAHDGWVWTDNDSLVPPRYSIFAACPDLSGGMGGTEDQEGGLSTTDALGQSSGAIPGSSAEWVIKTPAHTEISSLSGELYIGHMLDPSNDWVPAVRADGSVISDTTCQDSVGDGEDCWIGGPPGEGGTPLSVSGLSAHELSIGIACQAPLGDECVTGGTEHHAWAAMYGSVVTLTDVLPPKLTEATGPLLNATSSYVHGSLSATLAGTDEGGGVAQLALGIDGKPISEYAPACDYSATVPCPLDSGPRVLTLDTASVSDGTHSLEVYATDAAENQSLITSKTITVDNTAPASPEGLTLTQDGDALVANWKNPGNQVAPITKALYQVCQPGLSDCGPVETEASIGPLTISLGAGSWEVYVWLEDAAGNEDIETASHAVGTVEVGTEHSGEGHPLPIVTYPPPGPTLTEPSPKPTSPTVRPLNISWKLRGRRLSVRLKNGSGLATVHFIVHRRGKIIKAIMRSVHINAHTSTAIFNIDLGRIKPHFAITIRVRIGRRVASATIRR